MQSLTEAEIKLLEKFGFRMNGLVAVHKKLEIEKDISQFERWATLAELEQQIKTLLRSQCRISRGR